MVICNVCGQAIVGEAEAEGKYFKTAEGRIVSLVRHDACAPVGGKNFQRIGKADLKKYLSPAMALNNELTHRRKVKR